MKSRDILAIEFADSMKAVRDAAEAETERAAMKRIENAKIKAMEMKIVKK